VSSAAVVVMGASLVVTEPEANVRREPVNI
jgi:hypothetical protein